MELNQELDNSFGEMHYFEEVEGGEYDDQGFYRLPDGDFYDPDGVYFNKEGKDKYGGYYDEEFNYIASKEYTDLLKEINEEHNILAEYGLDGEGDEEGEGEGDDKGKEGLEKDIEQKEDEEIKEYLLKEKIGENMRFIVISFTGMSSNKDDEKGKS